MAVEALDSGLYVSLVTVGDRLFGGGEETCASDKNGGGDDDDEQNEQEASYCLTRLCSELAESHATPTSTSVLTTQSDGNSHDALLMLFANLAFTTTKVTRHGTIPSHHSPASESDVKTVIMPTSGPARRMPPDCLFVFSVP